MLACIPLCFRSERTVVDGVALAPHNKASRNLSRQASDNTSIVNETLTQGSGRLLCALQRDVCAIQSKEMECRASAVVDLFLKSLGASAVRLYGMSEEQSSSGMAMLVLLAAAGRPGPGALSDPLPGCALELPISCPALGPATNNQREHPDGATSLLQSVIATKEPAAFRVSHAATLKSSRATSAPAAVFAALPLLCGARTLGIIWVAADEAAGPDAHELLTHPMSQQQLSISVSTVLAGCSAAGAGFGTAAAIGGGSNINGVELPYTCWLAGAVRRLAAAATLHALVAELTEALEGHVRRSYLVDVAVHVALVPSASSDVAYFLTQEASSTAVQPPTAIICSNTMQCIRRMVSASRLDTLLQQSQQPSSTSGSIARSRPDGGPGTPPTSTWATSGTGMSPPSVFGAVMATTAPATTTAAVGGAKAPKTDGAVSKLTKSGAMEHPWSAGRSIGMNSSTGAASAANGAGGGPSGTSQTIMTAQTPLASLLRAKAFKVSYTLIQRMMEAAGCGGGGGGGGTCCEELPAGLVVASCSRWVADVRRPCRDVCYMMTGGAGASPMAASGTIVTAQAAGSAVCGSAQSLVLLGIAIGGGEGGGSAASNGVFLGLYLAFPSLLPLLLLEAVRSSCRGLLQWSLARVVRHNLLDSLASEVDALRAGVPGSYAVVVLPAVHAPATVLDTSATSPGGGGSGGAAFLGTVASALPSSRERDREDLGSFHMNAVPGTSSSQPVLTGEVLPPGRMARTVTLAQSPAAQRTSPFLSGGCPFEEALGTLAVVNHTSTNTNPTNTLTMFGTAGGSERTVGGLELVSDLELTVELTGRGSCAPPAVSTGPIPTASNSSLLARAQTAAAAPALALTASPALAASDMSGAGGASQSPSSRGPPASINSPFNTASTGWRALMGALPRSMKRPHTSPSQPQKLGQQLVVGHPPVAATGVMGPALGSPLMTGASSGLVRELLPALCEGADMDGNDASPADVIATPAAVLTVQEADVDVGQRAHLGLLVESLLGSMRSAYAMDMMQTTNTTLPYDVISTRPTSAAVGASTEDLLDELQLYDILGEGASGVVLRGLLGTVPVAVKLIEMPQLDYASSLASDTSAAEARTTVAPAAAADTRNSAANFLATNPTKAAPDAARASQAVAVGGGGDSGGGGGMNSSLTTSGLENLDCRGDGGEVSRGSSTGFDPRLTREQVAARRCFYRNAMELAVLRSTTHVNIVQCLGVYDNVVLEHIGCQSGLRFCILRRCNRPDTARGASDSPICTAIITELCDSSLGAALAERSFPTQLPQTAAGAGRPSGSGPYKCDMRGIYLTLLEIALALRHLHARRLVHRDIKPANILLKASHSDPRGWTTKLADFGFALMLDRQDSQADISAAASQRADGVFGMLGSSSCGGAARLLNSGVPSSSATGGSSRAGGGDVFYTVQEQACGTVTHMAPEAMRPNSRIDAAVDIFSLGIIMWELVAGRGHRPYKQLHPDNIPAAVSGGMRPLFPDWVPLAYRRLATTCWASEPQRRPTAAEVVLSVKAQMESLGSMHVHPKLQTATHTHRHQGGATGGVRGA